MNWNASKTSSSSKEISGVQGGALAELHLDSLDRGVVHLVHILPTGSFFIWLLFFHPLLSLFLSLLISKPSKTLLESLEFKAYLSLIKKKPGD